MNIKILFFPVVLVFTLYVAIAMIFPEYENSGQLKSNLEEKQKFLSDIQERKRYIAELKSSLNANADKENFIISYISKSREEERIISTIDRLAVISGVSISNLSIEEHKGNPVKTEILATESNALLGSVGRIEDHADIVAIPVEISPEVEFVKLKIGVLGEYSNIKNFLNQLDGVGIYNSIDSVVIEKSNDSENDKTSEKIISASLTVNFGYLNELKNKRILAESIDFSVFDKIKEIVKETPKNPDIGQFGKENPFLP